MNSKENNKNILLSKSINFDNCILPAIVINIDTIIDPYKKEGLIKDENLDDFLEKEIFFQKKETIEVDIIDINKKACEFFLVKDKDEFRKNVVFLLDGKFNEIIYLIIRNFCFKDDGNYLYIDTHSTKYEGKFSKVTVSLILTKELNCAYIYFDSISEYSNLDKYKKEITDKYTLLFDSIDESVAIFDLYTESIVEVNGNLSELIKKEVGDLVGSYVWCHFDKKDINKLLHIIKESSEENIPKSLFEIYLVKGDSKKIPVHVRVNTGFIADRHVALISINEISSQIRIEERRKLLSTAVEQSAESVVITDPNGNIQYVNPAFEEITGYSFPEILGKNPRILKSGEVTDSQYKLMWAEISSGKVWQGTLVNKKKSGEHYTEEVTITPVKDNFGVTMSYVAVKRDITQRLILENQIRQSQKMQAIGTLAGGVAHDFNNILTAILGYAELSQARCDNGSLIYSNLEEIIRASDRAAHLVDQILKFSRQSEKNVSTLKISLIIKEVLKLLRASLPANIELTSDISNSIYVKADPTQIHQILMNLCTNAYQSLEGKKGVINICLKSVTLNPSQGVRIGNLPHGQYACIQVKDNGIGIPESLHQRIFEPYFTTKKVNEGTGLGLSVVHGIVNDHGGAVALQSTPGKGSCFSVYLPEVIEDTLGNIVEGKSRMSSGVHRILIVDDEQPIVYYMANVLEQYGYLVATSISSMHAYQLFINRPDDFDLVITDMGMPGMTGLELATELKKIRPSIPIVLCTGYSEQVTADNFEQKGLAGFIAKPFNAKSIMQEINRILP